MSDDDDLDKLVKLTAERNSKKRKFDLSEFDSTIEKMLGLNVSLPVIQNWFEEKEIKISLPALRRYIIRTFGNDLYTAFLERNGWTKTKSNDNTRKPRKPRANTDDNTTATTPNLDEDTVSASVDAGKPKKPTEPVNQAEYINPLISAGIGRRLELEEDKPKTVLTFSNKGKSNE